MKTYVTFGQSHVHKIDSRTLDKDCVAVIHAESKEDGRKKAFELFNGKFCFEYFEDEFDKASLKYYPKGLIEI